MNVDRPKPPSASEAIVFEIISLVISLILAIFLSASLLYTLIKQDGHSYIFTPDVDFSMKNDMSFFDCIYVVFVIIGTLGFGDFVPNNFLGRLYVVLLLSATAILIPARVSRLVDTIGKKPRYMNEYIPEAGQSHIVIFANLTPENFQKLITLILAEGTNSAEIVEDAVPIALMSHIQPSSQLQLLLVHPMYSRKVQFFVGSAKSEIDLARVRACEAKAILIFNDHDITDKIDVVDQDDYSTKLKIVSIINYLSHELALRKQISRPVIISQTVSHEVCTSLLNFGVDHIISITNMKYTLLAYAALFPGFLSLFVNLVVPSTIYNKKGATSNPKKWKNEFEWGNSFELLEIPILNNTSVDMKRLSFSQTCRFLYERSNGTVICVAVVDHKDKSGVILNPERRVRIGDCKSLFVICNDVDLTIAILKTENLRTVLRKLRSKREFGIPTGKNYEFYGLNIDNSEALPLPKTDTFKIALARKRTSTAVSSQDVHLNIHNQNPITFKRHTSCFKKDILNIDIDNESNQGSSVTSPQSISVLGPTTTSTKNSPDDNSKTEKFPVVRVQSNIIIQDWDYQPPSEGRHAGEYSIISQPSVNIDKNEFISHRRFKLHTVLVCAFSPQFSIPRIVAAIETFLNAFRSKSSDTIVVLAAHAIQIEEFIQKRVKERNEVFDSGLIFTEGMPNSVRGLQSVDVCHARCIVIIGNEYIDKESDVDENREVNRDLYIVLAALELDSILKFYIKLLRKHNRPAELPIVIQELYNESTASFLPDIYQVFVKQQNIWENYEKKIIQGNRGISFEENDENDDSSGKSQFRKSSENYVSSQKLKSLHKLQDHSYIPNPAYSQGRVLSGSVIDTLTVQMLYNPNLLEFWQISMGMKKEEDLWMRQDGGSSSENDPFQSGSFDILEIPREFHGTFGELFQYLLICYGTITIGLFRYPESQSSYVAILPPFDSLVLPDDHAMVLLTKRPTENVVKEDVFSALHEVEQEPETKTK